MNGLMLTVFASFLSVVSLPIIIVGLIVAVVVVIGVIFLMRSGNKNKGTATGSSGDWQNQAQPGAWNQQGGWGQQGQWGAPNPAAQAGNWAAGSQNPWGAPAAQQQPTNPWEATPAAASQDPWGQQQAAASQQPAWGMQAGASVPVQQGQQAPAAFGASGPPAAGWGQPQQGDPWGSPAVSPVAHPTGLQAAGSPGLPSWQQAPGAGF